jgi:hypothetical protein
VAFGRALAFPAEFRGNFADGRRGLPGGQSFANKIKDFALRPG